MFVSGDRAGYWRLVGRSIVLCIGLGLVSIGGAALLGEPVLGLVYGAEYAEQHRLFVWITAAGAVSYPGWVLLAALSAAQSFRSETAAHVASLGAVLVASWWWIPTHGLQGAVWVLFVAYGVQLVVRVAALAMLGGAPPQARDASTTSSSPESRSH